MSRTKSTLLSLDAPFLLDVLHLPSNKLYSLITSAASRTPSSTAKVWTDRALKLGLGPLCVGGTMMFS